MSVGTVEARERGLRAWERAGVVATIAIIFSVPLFLGVQRWRGPRLRERPVAVYTGSEACGACHKKEMDAWRTSNHGRAMAIAREGTVEADFNNTTFKQGGKTTRFSRQGDKYRVQAEGPQGRTETFDVTHTFGWSPLQQYLVPFPGGRLQCLTVAWDVPKRRWYALYPDQEIPPGDWLHWTRPAQNWNTMCSDCHSTGVRKRYDATADTFATTWSEITVGCEACHGPGSLHEAWARKPPLARARVKNAALPVKTSNLGPRELVNLCAPCHSRRAQMRDQELPGGEPLDTYLPVLLSEGRYHADGQILEEDYEYQSFIQSKMYEKGVKCSDCHDVHRARRHAEGNALCLKCHRADTYDGPNHHFHKKEVNGRPSPGASCPSCHMPGRTYMGVHFRRDHSIRLPRPDLGAETGAPDACSECHVQQGPESTGAGPKRSRAWVMQAWTKWYGIKRKPHYGTVIAAAREGRSDAREALLKLAADRQRPSIVRATAMDLLVGYPGNDTNKILAEGLADEEPMIRRVAASRLALDDPRALMKALLPLTADPVLGVRVEAATRLAGLPQDGLSASQAGSLRAALDELQRTMAYMADMPSGRYNWGNLWQALGNAAQAEKEYRKALELDGHFDMARVNLALLLSGVGKSAEAEKLLREVLSRNPRNAAVAFDLALLVAEAGKKDEAQALLRQALEAEPRMAQAAYNLAVLVADRHPVEAARLAERAARLRPDEPRYGYAMAIYLMRAGQVPAARQELETLVGRFPDHAEAAALLAKLRGQQKK